MFMCDKCSNVYVRKDKFQQHLTNCIDRSTSNQQISMASLSPVMIEIGGSDFGHAIGSGGSDYLLDLARTYGLPEELYVNEDTNITHEDNNEENRSEDITIAINDHEHAPQVTIAEELYVNEDINDNHEDEIEEKRMNIAIKDHEHVPPVIILDEEIESSSEKICSARNGENVLEYKVELADCTRYMLKQLKHQAKHSAVKQQEFLKWCIMIIGSKLDDPIFMNRFAVDMGFYDAEEFMNFINLDKADVVGKRGRPRSRQAERQLMYDHWLSNSDISNDRRNARHMVKLKSEKRDPAVLDLFDSSITTFTKNKKNKSEYVKAQKYIYSRPIREMFDKFKKEHPECTYSMSLYWRCKPFYVVPPSDHKLEGCLCKKCLNPHALYGVLKKHIKTLPLSLSEYLTMEFEFRNDKVVNFPKVECIKGLCKNECSIVNDEHMSYDWKKRRYEETNIETYFDKKGEKKDYSRTTRDDYKDVELKEVYQCLQASTRQYLLHRYHTLVDKIYWGKFLDETDEHIVWLDYSMNIKLTEKNQIQSAHYSGKQQTLHDVLIRQPSTNVNKYVYHLSDDTNHDSVMTRKILEEIVIHYPQVISSGRLVLRSDNCSTQYKSKFVFPCLWNLAKK